jgi:hypothetical protein
MYLDHKTSKNNFTEAFTQNPADAAYKAIPFAEKKLPTGFTTIRDLGGIVNIALRNAVNKGYADLLGLSHQIGTWKPVNWLILLL